VLWQSVGSVDVPSELGAEFIHGDAPETSALMREAGLTSVPTSDASWTCGTDGVLTPSNSGIDPGDIFEDARALAADESVDVFLRRFESDPKTRDQAQLARIFVEGFEAADPALASARAIGEELRSGVDSTSSRPVQSYAPLFDRLAERCARAGADIRLGTTAKEITWKTGSVSVGMKSGSTGTSTLHAKRAIITVPAGVLQQRDHATPLSFVPPLPQEKQAAFNGLEMGHAVRVVLAFRTPFWEHVAAGRYRDAGFFRCEGGAFNAFWTQTPLRSRAIVAWAGGPRATAMNAMTAQARIDRARDEFGAMFGEGDLARREFEAGATHDWSRDPFACGAYSYVTTGARNARAMLGAPVDDTLFFAGEATSTDGQGGTVSGAFGTGMRAACEAALALGIEAAATRGGP
jgi:monoamine oxidase